MLSLLIPLAQAQTNPPDALIENALVADIPPEGFERIVDIIPSLIPEDLAVPDVSQEIERGGWTCLDDIWFDISNLNIGVEVVDADIVPQEGYLDFNVSLDVNLNDAINPFDLDYVVTFCVEYNCAAYVDPFQVDISSQIFFTVDDLNLDGINDLDVSFENFNYNYDLSSDDINVDDCALSVFEDILNFFGLSVFDLIIGIVEPEIENLVSDLVPTLETTMEEAFNQLSIQESVDLMGANLNISLEPEDIMVKPEGLRVQMNGSATTDTPARCIAGVDPNGSLATQSTLRPIGYAPTGVNGDVNVTIDDDFANQVLYQVWRTGALCQTIDAETFPIDTSILNLITGDAFVDLFPETSPLIIETVPLVPLEMNLNTQSDVAIDLTEMGLEFFADVDGRQTHILTLAMTTDIGVDIPFNAQTGDLTVTLDLDGDRVTPTLPYKEFTPNSEELITTSFIEQFDTILGIIDIDSLLGDLSFTLPSINGVGLTDLEFAATGQNNQDFGAFVSIGVVPYSGGCSDDEGSGCGGEGEGGCSSQGPIHPRLAMLLGVMCFGFIRRRSS
jgi:hypothetical protein